MKVTYDKRFQLILDEYDLPPDLDFDVDIPEDVQEILDEKIAVSEFGICLGEEPITFKHTGRGENQSTYEDDENHFHVDWYVGPHDNKGAFMLGVKTLILLAAKFEKEGRSGVRLTYSFQTPELGKEWAVAHGVYNEEDEQYISDRLSFHTRREGERILEIEPEELSFWGHLIIDI